MKNVELSIPDMQSAHCQLRVNGAIKDIDGIKVEKLEAGKLSVSVENDEVKEELVEAIEKKRVVYRTGIACFTRIFYDELVLCA